MIDLAAGAVILGLIVALIVWIYGDGREGQS